MFKTEESFCKIIKFRFNYTFSVSLGLAFWRAFRVYVKKFKTLIFLHFLQLFFQNTKILWHTLRKKKIYIVKN